MARVWKKSYEMVHEAIQERNANKRFLNKMDELEHKIAPEDMSPEDKSKEDIAEGVRQIKKIRINVPDIRKHGFDFKHLLAKGARKRAYHA